MSPFNTTNVHFETVHLVETLCPFCDVWILSLEGFEPLVRHLVFSMKGGVVVKMSGQLHA